MFNKNNRLEIRLFLLILRIQNLLNVKLSYLFFSQLYNFKLLFLFADHSLPNTCDPDDVYINLMKAVNKKGSLENFRKNKPLMKLIAEQNHTANMNKDEEKKFYEGVYKCPLFKKH